VSATIDLSQLAVAGHRIEPKINIEGTDELLPAEARRAFLPRDTLKVDLLVLQRGLARLEGRQRPAERPSLILTVSFLTLSNGNTRNALLDEIERARDAVTKGVIFEVSDFDDGVPAGRLMEIAALLKPFCRSVFARAGQTRASARSLRSLGFSGIVLDSPPATATDVDQSLWLLSMSAGLQGLKGAAIAANLTSTRVLPMAAEAGFTHATVKM
jgi:hypothetical protein